MGEVVLNQLHDMTHSSHYGPVLGFPHTWMDLVLCLCMLFCLRSSYSNATFVLRYLNLLALFSVHMKYSLVAKPCLASLFACSHPEVLVFLTYWKWSVPSSVLDLHINQKFKIFGCMLWRKLGSPL